MSGAIAIPGGPSFAGAPNGVPVPAISITVPYARTTYLHVPRRDLVLGLADSLFLRVTVVDSDSVDAQALELTGGLGGPSLQMIVWPDTHYRTSWDYGARPHCPPPPIWTGLGVVSDALGAFDISFPTNTMASWPRRCAYAMQLDWDGGGGASLLTDGHIHLRPSVARTVQPIIMLPDPNPAVLTDPDTGVIYLDGALSS